MPFRRFMRVAVIFYCLVMAGVVTAADLRDVLGSSHIGGRYSFNLPWPVPDGDTAKRDYLNEGAAELQALGSRVIKVQLHPNSKAFYWYTLNPGFPYGYPIFVPPAGRLAYMAQSPQYAELWNRPFTTYVIAVMANMPVSDGMGGEDISKFGSVLRDPRLHDSSRD